MSQSWDEPAGSSTWIPELLWPIIPFVPQPSTRIPIPAGGRVQGVQDRRRHVDFAGGAIDHLEEAASAVDIDHVGRPASWSCSRFFTTSG